MMSMVSGCVVFLSKITRIVGPSRVLDGPFVRKVSRFRQVVCRPGRADSWHNGLVAKASQLTVALPAELEAFVRELARGGVAARRA
jgi:hypothetical protein